MSIIGKVECLWRYPVKSMRGEELQTASVGSGGVAGDRLFAFHNSISPKTFPYLTARQQPSMLLYRPRLRESDSDGKMRMEVLTPDGDVFSIEDPALIRELGTGLKDDPTITLLRSDNSLSDCYPVSLFSLQTVRQLGDELGVSLDPRRFRANIYLDLADASGFGEDAFVGRTLRLGSTATVFIVERDKRCKMISLDPDSGESNPEILRHVAHYHESSAGVYGTVLVEGTIVKGDTVELLD